MLCEEQLERESQPPHLKLELETGAGSASSEGAIDEVFQGLKMGLHMKGRPFSFRE